MLHIVVGLSLGINDTEDPTNSNRHVIRTREPMVVDMLRAICQSAQFANAMRNFEIAHV